MSQLTAVNGPRRRATGPKMQAQYRCLLCPFAMWTAGGVSGVIKHRMQVHGLSVWPDVQSVDDGFEVDFEGNRIRRNGKHVSADASKDAWMRTVPEIVISPKDREGR